MIINCSNKNLIIYQCIKNVKLLLLLLSYDIVEQAVERNIINTFFFVFQ